jgi:hypothetical protein
MRKGEKEMQIQMHCRSAFAGIKDTSADALCIIVRYHQKQVDRGSVD